MQFDASGATSAQQTHIVGERRHKKVAASTRKRQARPVASISVTDAVNARRDQSERNSIDHMGILRRGQDENGDEGAIIDLTDEKVHFPYAPVNFPREEALRVFGRWISHKRGVMSLEDFTDRVAGEGGDMEVTPAVRSVEWLSAVERGDLFPSTLGFMNLRRALGVTYGNDDDPIKVYSELLLDPYGLRSQAIKRTCGIELDRPKVATRSAARDEKDSSWMPVPGRISKKERLLTISPLLSLGAVVAAFGLLHPWDYSNLDISVPNAEGLGAVGVVAATLLYPAIPEVGRWLSSLAASVRRRIYKQGAADGVLDSFTIMTAYRLGEHEAATAPTRTYFFESRHNDKWYRQDTLWFVERDLPYLIPNYREKYRSVALEIDIAERLTLVTATLIPISAVAIALSLFVGIPQREHVEIGDIVLSRLVPWVLTFVIAYTTVKLSTDRIRRLAGQARSLLEDAYGSCLRDSR